MVADDESPTPLLLKARPPWPAHCAGLVSRGEVGCPARQVEQNGYALLHALAQCSSDHFENVRGRGPGGGIGHRRISNLQPKGRTSGRLPAERQWCASDARGAPGRRPSSAPGRRAAQEQRPRGARAARSGGAHGRSRSEAPGARERPASDARAARERRPISHSRVSNLQSNGREQRLTG